MVATLAAKPRRWSQIAAVLDTALLALVRAYTDHEDSGESPPGATAAAVPVARR
ncbi:MAG: hypothetical protein ACRDRK_06970 [Pseudonocardia sp.]